MLPKARRTQSKIAPPTLGVPDLRRISPHRPHARFRNPARRLRALRRWAAGFGGDFPAEHAELPCFAWKIPVLDRLVRPPTTTPALQAGCAQCLIDAAGHLARARPAGAPAARVAAIRRLALDAAGTGTQPRPRDGPDPAGGLRRGAALRGRPEVYRREVWLIGEVL